MAQNFLKSYKKNLPKPTVLSYSRSISTITNHHKSISFMPKLLLKTLHRRKLSHHRSLSNSSIINANKNFKDLGTKNDEKKIENIKKIDKQFQRNNKLMQLIPLPRRVTSMMSILFRNNKQHDQERCKDHKPRDVAKRGSKKSRSNEVPRDSSTSSSINCKFGAGNVVNLTVNGGKISRVKSARDIEEHSEAKGGLKIKRIIKIKSREREKEKRFELCKKKILMGEKCKPLHGSLHYDKNGVLVPEDFT